MEIISDSELLVIILNFLLSIQKFYYEPGLKADYFFFMVRYSIQKPHLCYYLISASRQLNYFKNWSHY